MRKPHRGLATGLASFKSRKQDNKEVATPAKIALRHEAIKAVGGADAARVLDIFAGRGVMWAGVWRNAARYVGCDVELDQVFAHPVACHHVHADIALRVIDLAAFNIFDLDAYGSPWTEMHILAARRHLLPGERVAISITDGAPRRALMGLTAHALASLVGCDPRMKGAHRRWPELVRLAMEEVARRMGGRLEGLRQPAAGLIPGDHWMYYGLAVLVGGPVAAPDGP